MIAQFHRFSGGQHGVDQNQSLPVEARRCEVFDKYIEVFFLAVFPVGRHKCVFSSVEDVEESLMEWNARTEYCGEYYLGVDYVAFAWRKRGVDRLLAVAECAAYLEGHYFAYAFEIAAEAEHVALDVDIAQLHHVLADYRGVFGEVYYFHLL
ncbi:hypothetical protein IMSAG192_00484 [Muribaculaceae bacterium]|nr:hypothetical protein IMSAG192_00484 [Muribaculaceae bacterium]